MSGEQSISPEDSADRNRNPPTHPTALGLKEPNREPWYAARSVFRWLHVTPDFPGHEIYEERIVLIQATSFEDAFRRAEVEAREYSSGMEMEFMEVVDVYHLFERKLGDRVEVFSLLRESTLPAKEYVRSFFQTGHEHRGKLDEP